VLVEPRTHGGTVTQSIAGNPLTCAERDRAGLLSASIATSETPGIPSSTAVGVTPGGPPGSEITMILAPLLVRALATARRKTLMGPATLGYPLIRGNLS
jgi:hypothetical protein